MGGFAIDYREIRGAIRVLQTQVPGLCSVVWRMLGNLFARYGDAISITALIKTCVPVAAICRPDRSISLHSSSRHPTDPQEPPRTESSCHYCVSPLKEVQWRRIDIGLSCPADVRSRGFGMSYGNSKALTCLSRDWTIWLECAVKSIFEGSCAMGLNITEQ